MSIGTDKVKGLLLVLLASALWSGSGTLAKILKTRGADIYDIFAWRYLFGLASLCAFRLVFQRGQSLALEGRVLRMSLFSALVILTVLLAPVTVFTLFRGIPTENYVYLLAFGVFCTALPLLLVNLSGLFLKAHEMSIVSLSEVPISILLGMVLLKEIPSLVVWGGVVLTISDAFLVAAKEE